MSASLPMQANPQKRKRMGWIVLIFLVLIPLAVFTNLRFLRSNPARKHTSAGIDHLRAHNLREAEKEWRAAIAADPTAPTAYLLLANLYMEAGSADRALPLLEQVQSLAPNTKHLRCRLAEAYTFLGRDADAAKIAAEAVSQEPDCARANAIMGIQLGNQSKTGASVEALAKAHRLDPQNLPITLSYAQAQLSALDLEGSATTTRKALQQDPKSGFAHYLLGWNYARRQPTPENRKTAIESFRKAVEIDPTQSDAQTELGQLLTQAQQYKEAQQALEVAWKQNPNNAQVAYNLAKAYRALGNTQKADQMTRTFARLNADEDRYQALRKQFATNPKNITVALQLAEMDIARGQTQEAFILVRDVLQRENNHARALDLAAQLQRIAANGGRTP